MMPGNNKKRTRCQMLPDCGDEFDLEAPLTNAEVAEWVWGEQQVATLSAAQTYKWMLIEKLLTINDLLASLKAGVKFSAAKRESAKKYCFDSSYSKQKQLMFLNEYTQYATEGAEGMANIVAHLELKAKVRKSLEEQEAVIARLTMQRFKSS